MKALALYALLIPFWSFGQDTIYYESGKVKAVGSISDQGEKYGKWSYYYPSGKMSAELHFQNGLQNGLQKTYSFDGVLISIENWKNNNLTDSAFYFHENGKLKRKGIYRQSLYEGVWVFYTEEGVLEQEGSYVDGLPNGLWLTYAENGKVLQEGEYKNGKANGLWRFYDDSGQQTYEGLFEEDQREGQWYRFTKSGKKKKWKFYKRTD